MSRACQVCHPYRRRKFAVVDAIQGRIPLLDRSATALTDMLDAVAAASRASDRAQLGPCQPPSSAMAS